MTNHQPSRGPSLLGWLAVFALLLVTYFLIAGRTRLLGDPDTFWHIAVGRAIFDSGLIHTDDFSFTRNGEAWVANQWLAECLLAVFDRLGGFDGVFVLTVAVLTATYLAVARRWLLRGFDPLLTITLVTLILSASAYTFNARPHVFSIAFLAVSYAVLRDVEDGRRPVARLLWLVPLFVLWSNLHGGVLGGMGTLGLAAGGWTALWLLGRPKTGTGSLARPKRGTGTLAGASPRFRTAIYTGRDAALVWLCVAGCGLALFATPYGTGSLVAWRTIMGMSLPDLIIEHAPLDLATPQGWLVVVLFVVYASVLAATPRGWPRVTFWLPVVWFILACTRIRHAPLFAVAAGLALADLLPQSRLAGWLARRGWLRPAPEDAGEPSGRDRAAGIVVLVVAMLPLFAAAVWMEQAGPLPLVGDGWARPTERVWPAGLVDPLGEFEAQGSDGTPIFNEPILGGFLIYNFPRLGVFMDGRCELYGEPFLREVVAAWREPAVVDRWQAEYGFEAAVIEADSPLRHYFDATGEWRLIASTPTAKFYRMGGAFARAWEP